MSSTVNRLEMQPSAVINHAVMDTQLTTRLGLLWKCQTVGGERYKYQPFSAWSSPDYCRPFSRYEDVLQKGRFTTTLVDTVVDTFYIVTRIAVGRE